MERLINIKDLNENTEVFTSATGRKPFDIKVIPKGIYSIQNMGKYYEAKGISNTNTDYTFFIKGNYDCRNLVFGDVVFIVKEKFLNYSIGMQISNEELEMLKGVYGFKYENKFLFFNLKEKCAE